MDRHRLISKLRGIDAPDYLVNISQQFLTGTRQHIDGKTYDTNVGVPQGAVTSPTFFNIYINDLLQQLEHALAFADDLLLIGDNRSLTAQVGLVKRWCAENGIGLNCSKSALLHIRPDRRTRQVPIQALQEFPLVSQAKYLGVMIDEDLSFRTEDQQLKVTLAK